MNIIIKRYFGLSLSNNINIWVIKLNFYQDLGLLSWYALFWNVFEVNKINVKENLYEVSRWNIDFDEEIFKQAS